MHREICKLHEVSAMQGVFSLSRCPQFGDADFLLDELHCIYVKGVLFIKAQVREKYKIHVKFEVYYYAHLKKKV